MQIRFLVLAFLSSPAFALSVDDVREIIASSPQGSFSASNHGYLCESLGVAAVKEWAPDAEVLNGVDYRVNGRTIGELDLVVIENEKVSEVIEVKCMKSFSGAAHKADEQLERFSAYIGRCDVDFSLDGDDVPCSIFDGPEIKLSKMSYLDARPAGFDYDIGVTRKELLELIEAN